MNFDATTFNVADYASSGNSGGFSGKNLWAGEGHATVKDVISTGNINTTGSLSVGNITSTENITTTGGKISANTTTTKNGNRATVNGGNVNATNLIVSGPSSLNGGLSTTTINANAGGNFSGGRYYFNDSENCGKLRVGCAWGKPGIYAEPKDAKCSTCSDDLVLGSKSARISLQNGTGTNLVGNVSTTGNLSLGGDTLSMANDISLKTFPASVYNNNKHWELGEASSPLFYASNGVLRKYAGNYSTMPRLNT